MQLCTNVEAGGRRDVQFYRFVSSKYKRAVLQILHKRGGWGPIVLCRFSLFVLFCAVLCRFVSFKERRAIFQILPKGRGWRPLCCAELCRFVPFCIVLYDLKIDIRFCNFCTNVEAGGRSFMPFYAFVAVFLSLCVV